jgi:Asp-tRNA(Asn)/Glu-tRNA(Gln) amidotransferase A subunit family amidase
MPTEDGTVLHAGRTPVRDAAVVAMLRAAGAVMLGKTVTTECATYSPGKTRNPHNPAHTPGGSSSGSAAAVAAGMVPIALGTQTNGSVIRPASYCGVYGFKPSFGLIPRSGILRLSRTLDHVGVFARTVEDIALACEQLVGWHEDDPDTLPRARPRLLETAAAQPPMPPRVALVKTPRWGHAAEDTRAAFGELVEALGESIAEHELAESLGEAWDWHRTVMEAEMAANLAPEWEKGRDRLSASLRGQLERGRAVTALAYQQAQARREIANAAFDTLWTYCGMPAIALPLMRGENGLPLGVQLVARRGDDARLLRTARWLAARLSNG